MELYHVCENWDGGDLRPLGDEDAFLARWPEAGELAQVHAHCVHMYSSLADAEDHAAVFGGEVLVIDAACLDVTIDSLEFDHPVTDRVPASAITRYVRG